MNILHVYKTYFPDSFAGIERVIWELAEGTAAEGASSRVLSLSPFPKPSPMAVASHQGYRARQDISIASSAFSLSAFPAYRELWRWADLVHYHYPWPMMDLLHLANRRHRAKPAVVTYHSDIVRQRTLGQLYAPVRNAFLASVDAIVATSPQYAASSRMLQRYSSKVTTIPIGLSERSPPKPTTVERWRARLAGPFFLFVGAARYYKGLQFLIEAARRITLPVVLAGSFEAAALPGPLPVNVTLTGPIDDDDKEALLELCVALVLPSHLRSEAYGLVLVEGARASRPLISCELGTGTSFVNRDGETGLVVAPTDVEALGAAMKRLWTNRDLAAALGIAARRHYAQSLAADQMVRSYQRLYGDLLNRA